MRLRPPFGLALAVAVWLMCLLAVVAVVTEGSVRDVIAVVPWLVLAAYVVWMLFWTPAVVVGDQGVRLRNLARTHDVAWSAIVAIRTRYNLVLVTPDGSYAAWAAPAPGVISSVRGKDQAIEHLPGSTYGAGRSIGIGDLPRSDSGVAAYHVRRGLERRDAGDLPADDGSVVTTWHRVELGLLAALLCVAVLATALAH